MRKSAQKQLLSTSFAERVSRLNQKNQERIRPVQERPRDFVLMSIRDLASRLGTDPATVLRIVRQLGFSSYRDFKAYLHELSIATATSLEGMQVDPVFETSLVAQGRRALEIDLKNLQALSNTLDMKRIRALVRRLYQSRNIVIIAGDMAASLARMLDYKLTLLGLPTVCVTSAGKTFHVVNCIGRKDILFAISFQRGLRQTVEGLRHARANGAHCVGITNTAVSPIVRFANEYFLTPVDAPFSLSYVAPVAFINVLLTLCANYNRGRTLKILRRVDQEQRHGFRWYPL